MGMSMTLLMMTISRRDEDKNVAADVQEGQGTTLRCFHVRRRVLPTGSMEPAGLPNMWMKTKLFSAAA